MRRLAEDYCDAALPTAFICLAVAWVSLAVNNEALVELSLLAALIVMGGMLLCAIPLTFGWFKSKGSKNG